MEVKIEASWKFRLQEEFKKSYFSTLAGFVRSEYKNHTVYPPGKLVFNAFNHCPFDSLKVVIIGQDPYHQPGQANGLCFSVNDGVRKPPSLTNIFTEMHNDTGNEIPRSGNLERWAKQGVLLLNATLTVRANSPGSHQNKGWEVFTDAVIRTVSAGKDGIVFLLWGAYAQRKADLVDHSKHLVLKSAHPSPLAANKGFFGNNHFSKSNAYLESLKKEPVQW